MFQPKPRHTFLMKTNWLFLPGWRDRKTNFNAHQTPVIAKGNPNEWKLQSFLCHRVLRLQVKKKHFIDKKEKKVKKRQKLLWAISAAAENFQCCVCGCWEKEKHSYRLKENQRKLTHTHREAVGKLWEKLFMFMLLACVKVVVLDNFFFFVEQIRRVSVSKAKSSNRKYNKTPNSTTT